MNRLSAFWSNAIAYVALLVGAGLSVAGNVADTFRTRGEATDGLDIILAGAWPVLVILTIEMFVSRRWSPAAGFQALRWIGCLAIGNLAMLVSWLHLHDLFLSRGQVVLVSIAGPLAIDCMAIMATGLILSTRGKLATVHSSGQLLGLSPSTDQDWMDAEDSVASRSRFADGDIDLGEPQSVDSVDIWAELDARVDSVQPVSAVPVSPAPSSNSVRPESVPADAADLIMTWMATDPSERPAAGDVDKLLATEFSRSPRAIRRWRDSLKG